MEGTAHPAGLALCVERPRLGQRRRALLERDDRVELRPVPIIGVDSRQVELDEFLGGQGPLLHGRLKVGDRGGGEFELGGPGGQREGEGQGQGDPLDS